LIVFNSSGQVEIADGELIVNNYVGPSATLASATHAGNFNGNVLVSGTVKAGAFKVGTQYLNVPDYVFDEGHPLMPLDELREFVVREKHLPNIPSADEIKKHGLSLSDFQMKLLEKIEELTLHTLAQQEEIETLKAQLNHLKVKPGQ